MPRMTDAELMERAVALAWSGWGRVHPNPLVGAVVLDAAGALAGEGWHAEFGGRTGSAPHFSRPVRAPGADPDRVARAVQPPGQAAPVYRGDSGRRHQARGVRPRGPHPEAAGGAEALRGAGVVVEGGIHRPPRRRKTPPSSVDGARRNGLGWR